MKLPSYAETLGVSVRPSVDGGAPLVTLPFREELEGRPSFIHGGAIGGLLEVAAIVALRDMLERENAAKASIKPVNVMIDFMRGGREEITYACGFVTRIGHRVANVDAIAWQSNREEPIARAQLHYLIIRS